jgi:hypothetical protein
MGPTPSQSLLDATLTASAVPDVSWAVPGPQIPQKMERSRNAAISLMLIDYICHTRINIPMVLEKDGKEER